MMRALERLRHANRDTGSLGQNIVNRYPLVPCDPGSRLPRTRNQVRNKSVILTMLCLSATAPVSADEGVVINQTVVNMPTGTYVLSKLLSADGQLSSQISDLDGKPVPDSVLAGPTPSKIGDQLREALQTRQEEFIVAVSLADPPPSAQRSESGRLDFGAFTSDASLNSRVVLDGIEASPEWVAVNLSRRDHELAQSRFARVAFRRSQIADLDAHERWNLGVDRIEQLARREVAFVVSVGKGDVSRLAEYEQVTSVEMYSPPHNETITTAMNATGVSCSSGCLLQNYDFTGTGVGVWLQESCSPPDGYIANYKRMNADCDDLHARNTVAIVRATSPHSFIYGSSDSEWPDSSDIPGWGGYAPIRIVSFSAGYTPTSGNYNGHDKDADNWVYNNRVAVFKSAGNEAATCESKTGFISGPGNAYNVNTVGNYVDSDTTGTSSRVPTQTSFQRDNCSSWRNAPNTKHNKPEFMAPGTNINAGTTPGGVIIAMSGTSQATPHAAGIGADLLDAYPVMITRPELLKASLLVGAIDVIAPYDSGDAVDQVGRGGLDALAAAYNNVGYWWEGANGDWNALCNLDNTPNDGVLTVDIQVTAGHGNALALAWINRGTYTANHTNDAFPIGTDFDFSVRELTGPFFYASSTSAYNAYEVTKWVATATQTLRVSIWRTHNRDTAARYELALVHKYW